MASRRSFCFGWLLFKLIVLGSRTLRASILCPVLWMATHICCGQTLLPAIQRLAILLETLKVRTSRQLTVSWAVAALDTVTVRNCPQLTVTWAVAVLGGDVIRDALLVTILKYRVSLTMLLAICASACSPSELTCSAVLVLRLSVP